mmetsp:Transcript_11715/g.35131  ORF Transcript_11715/g.35131 Transcript_11715/m.35131 type:complete len:218 (-) Transcript_11715:182-835(-)
MPLIEWDQRHWRPRPHPPANHHHRLPRLHRHRQLPHAHRRPDGHARAHPNDERANDASVCCHSFSDAHERWWKRDDEHADDQPYIGDGSGGHARPHSHAGDVGSADDDDGSGDAARRSRLEEHVFEQQRRHAHRHRRCRRRRQHAVLLPPRLRMLLLPTRRRRRRQRGRRRTEGRRSNHRVAATTARGDRRHGDDVGGILGRRLPRRRIGLLSRRRP